MRTQTLSDEGAAGGGYIDRGKQSMHHLSDYAPDPDRVLWDWTAS